MRLLDVIGDEHCLVLARELTEPQLLRDRVGQMLKTVNPSLHRQHSAVQDLSSVSARICSAGRDISTPARDSLHRAALDSLKRLVERYLDSPELSAEFICARSGWSRATVYRLFEAEGGLARYIRKRHLVHAFRELMSGHQSYRRIIDLAVAHQFSSEATFSRAFRRAFGIPPGKVRDLAAISRAPSAGHASGPRVGVSTAQSPSPDNTGC